MNLKLRLWWGRRRFWAKLALLFAAALAATLFTEAFCNLRAFSTQSLQPLDLAMESLQVDSVLPCEQTMDGVTAEKGKNQSVDLVYDHVDVPLRTVVVAMTGEGVLNVSVSFTDEASANTLVQVYSVYCVADDPALNICYATAESAGTAKELRIRLIPQSDDLFTVTRVTLNAPIPFQWQPIRMALVFAGALLLLCALFLRGFNAAYASGQWAHRLIVIVPLVMLLVFSLFLAQWIQPDLPLFAGVTDEAAAASDDIYAVLFETLRAGRLSVALTPNAELAQMENPYDQSARVSKGVRFKFDYAYYQGNYYIYYGLAPVLTVYAPYYALTGKVPASRDATLLMAWLTILFVGWAVCGVARRYLPGVNVFALSLSCVTAVVSAGTLFLLSSADFYYLAELSFVCFATGAIAFGLHATVQERRRLRFVQYALSGVCFALAAMGRPSAMPMLAAFLTPLFLCELLRKRARVREAAAFLIPAVLGIGAILLYNAARFGGAFDFGSSYQLTVADMRWSGVRLAELPQALYHYLLEPLGWTNRFPYLSVAYHASTAAGRYTFTLSNAGVLVYPVAWAALLAAPAFARFPAAAPALRRERWWTLLLPLIVSLPMMLISYGYAGAILRYTCDFRLFYALAGAGCAMALMSRADTPERKALSALCAALCVLSFFVGFGMLFDNERDYILKNSPQIYYGLQRMFFPY
ncbi:MAG: hypothetical protein LLF96_12020 [Eubacteriales bacterium]|nr:hypothetical protein [Eubacteriales bacterium]